MKNLFLKPVVVFVILIGVISCSNGDSLENYKLSEFERNRIINIVEDNLSEILYREENFLLSEYNNNNEEKKFLLKSPIQIEKSYLDEVNGKMLLVSIYKNYVTNSLLVKNERTKEYVYGKISCTTIKCSNSKGCIPKNAEECEPCGYGAGDCQKTVTKEYPDKEKPEKPKAPVKTI